MEQQLHTPEGVRDIYSLECKKKLVIQNKLHDTLRLYGYQDIQTPTFEFFDVFGKEIGTIPSRELYKFFDRDGNTLVLRPDMTPSIARAAATLFETEEMPIRLCYIGNTFINHSSYQGRLKENTQLGAELLGTDSIDADVEMLALLVDGLKSTGLKEFQVNIGHVDFIQSLMDETGFDIEQKKELRQLINNRNFFGVDEMLDMADVQDSVKHAFTILPELTGGEDILAQADEIAPNVQAKSAIDHLRQMHEMLQAYGVTEHITFDLSMSGSYGYYTGIIFRGYTYGTGDAIVRGGRYDHLAGNFGKDTPSIGFAIIIDELMNALSRQKIHIHCEHSVLIAYTEETKACAIKLAKEYRSKGRSVELVKRRSDKNKEDYKQYGKRCDADCMLYLEADGTMNSVNLLTGEETSMSCK